MTALLVLVAVTLSLALLARRAWLARRAGAALRARLDGLGERLDQLHLRLEATERDLAMAISQSGVAEGLLLEKGIADADEVEEMRRRLETDGDAPGERDAVH
jgi:division protein CdvB (Snf7/Vps24/ESCRT-III family)